MIGENAIEPNDERLSKIEEINKWIVTQIKPKDVTREEREMDRSYEEVCLLLARHTNKEVKRMTVFEFYTLLHLIKQKKIQ